TNLGYFNNANGVSFSPDSTLLAFSQNDTLSCFRVSDMNRLWLTNADDANIRSGPAVFTPDGYVVNGSRGGGGASGGGLDPTPLQIRDPLTGNIVKYFDVDTGLSWIVPAFSANGQFM